MSATRFYTSYYYSESVLYNVKTLLIYPTIKKVKVKSSMARSLPVENLLPQNVGSIMNYLQ